jgi:hypothetical protein
MKRLIAAVSFAVFAAPVLAAEVGAPYEQTQFDRGLTTQSTDNASSGSSNATSVWASDYNFVSPAQ